MNILKLTLLACSFVFNHFALANSFSDTAKEHRWVEQVVEQLIEGEAIFLKAQSHDFLSILTEAENVKGNIILLHGTGAHPDWPEVINPIRTRLPEEGWTTLSIQLPLPPEGADIEIQKKLFFESNQRILVAYKKLQSLNNKPISIISHSRAAAESLSFITDFPDIKLQTYIAIGMNATFQGIPDKRDPQYTLAKTDLPILDLFGSNDLPGILMTADHRKKVAGKNFSQIKVNNAGHFFSDKEDELLEVILNWLNQQYIK